MKRKKEIEESVTFESFKPKKIEGMVQSVELQWLPKHFYQSALTTNYLREEVESCANTLAELIIEFNENYERINQEHKELYKEHGEDLEKIMAEKKPVINQGEISQSATQRIDLKEIQKQLDKLP